MSGHDRLRLPLHFDAEALAADVATVADDHWLAHFNNDIYEGDWSGVSLRGPADAHSALYPDPTATEFVDSPTLARCPALRHALSVLRCPLTTVRLLRLGPGSSIAEHRDHRLRAEDGEARLHIPVTTNPDVEFRVGGEQVVLRAGECWYLDLTLPHSVVNRGQGPRVHLVVDCTVDAWLDDLLGRAGATT